jgi:hypothetical protein
MQQANDGCELVLQTEPCVAFAKLEAGVFEGFKDAECLVQVEHESERYRVVAICAYGLQVVSPCAPTYEGGTTVSPGGEWPLPSTA